MQRLIKDIRFQRETTYIGRNGMGRQIGIGLTVDANCALLEPINSKDHLAHCQIRIPSKDIPEVIMKLSMMYNELVKYDI